MKRLAFFIFLLLQSCNTSVVQQDRKQIGTVLYAEDSEAEDDSKEIIISIQPSLYTCDIHNSPIQFVKPAKSRIWEVYSKSNLLQSNISSIPLTTRDIKDFKFALYSICTSCAEECCIKKRLVCCLSPGKEIIQEKKLDTCRVTCIHHKQKYSIKMQAETVVLSTESDIIQNRNYRKIEKMKKVEKEITLGLNKILSDPNERFRLNKSVNDTLKTPDNLQHLANITGNKVNDIDVKDFSEKIVDNLNTYINDTPQYNTKLSSIQKNKYTKEEINEFIQGIADGFGLKVSEANLPFDRDEFVKRLQNQEDHISKMMTVIEHNTSNTKATDDNIHLPAKTTIPVPYIDPTPIQKGVLFSDDEEISVRHDVAVLAYTNYFIPSSRKIAFRKIDTAIEDIASRLYIGDELYKIRDQISDIFTKINTEMREIKPLYRGLKKSVKILKSTPEPIEINTDNMSRYPTSKEKNEIRINKLEIVDRKDTFKNVETAKKLLVDLEAAKQRLLDFANTYRQRFSYEDDCDSDFENDYSSDELQEYLQHFCNRNLSYIDKLYLSSIDKNLVPAINEILNRFSNLRTITIDDIAATFFNRIHAADMIEFLQKAHLYEFIGHSFYTYHDTEINYAATKYTADILAHATISKISKPYGAIFTITNFNTVKKNIHKLILASKVIAKIILQDKKQIPWIETSKTTKSKATCDIY